MLVMITRLILSIAFFGLMLLCAFVTAMYFDDMSTKQHAAIFILFLLSAVGSSVNIKEFDRLTEFFLR